MPMQQIMMAVAVQFRVPTVPEGAPAADVLGRCFPKLQRDRPTVEQLAEAFVTASSAADSQVSFSPVATSNSSSTASKAPLPSV